MKKIIFQPCADAISQTNFRRTIQSSISLSDIRESLPDGISDLIESHFPNGNFRAWGVKPHNASRWDKIRKGDVVLFSASNTFFHRATIVATIRDKNMAESIWGEDSDGKTWECIYILSDNRPSDIPVPDIAVNILGYKEKFRVQRFQVLNEEQSEAVFKVHSLEPDFEVTLPAEIQKKFILNALKKIDSLGYSPHKKNHTLELIHEERGYPPLAVLAFALELQLGLTSPIPAGYLRGEEDGKGFRLLKKAGFTIGRIEEPGDMEHNLLTSALKETGSNEDDPGEVRPRKRLVEKVEYIRSSQVINLALSRANGICEGCDNSTGFNRRTTGKPYLEVHHVKPLSEDGADKIWNVAALCPNCHKRCHFSEDRDDFNRSLYSKIPDLKNTP
jgi:hypothetical protein